MSIGLVGSKKGMTRVFTEAGDSVAVTVVEVLPNVITQIKSQETDGYSALQVTTGKKKANRVNKPAKGHFAKANVEPGRGLWEFTVAEDKLASHQVGGEIKVDIFNEGQLVDVTSVSKGKGFAGTVKRYNFKTQDATHGNSLSHRVPGSIGQNQSPGRVFKGKKLPGHMGAKQVTVQSQQLVAIDAERNLLLIKGTVPGAPGSDVIVKSAVKAGVQSEA